MKIFLLLCFFTVSFLLPAQAQQFIEKASIEFEVKTNVKKTMSNDTWDEMIKAQMPDFKTGYYNYTFANQQSIFKFQRWDEASKKIPVFMRQSDEENSWFFDHKAGTYSMQKNIFGSNFNLQDSIQTIKWKLSNENRVIAGFNCRKATGIIMDSVYVFAFFTEEIIIPGGPCSINGLPGMILGLTIPRMYTSYIATRIMVNDVNVAAIKPVAAKKYYSNASFKKELTERSSEWGSSDDPDRARFISQFMWSAFL